MGFRLRDPIRTLRESVIRKARRFLPRLLQDKELVQSDVKSELEKINSKVTVVSESGDWRDWFLHEKDKKEFCYDVTAEIYVGNLLVGTGKVPANTTRVSFKGSFDPQKKIKISNVRIFIPEIAVDHLHELNQIKHLYPGDTCNMDFSCNIERY